MVDYTEKVMKTLKATDEAESKEGVVKNFLNYCVKKDFTIKELLGHNFNNIEEIPFSDFVERLAEIEFFTDYQQELLSKLDTKSKKTVNYKNLRNIMNNAFKMKTFSQQTA